MRTPIFLILLYFYIIQFLVSCQRQTYLYELLQVNQLATSDELKKAFRKLSIKYHPDRHAGNQEIQKKYVEIKRAYQTLIDVAKRITYDLHGEAGLKELQKNPLRKGGDYRTEMWVPFEKFYTGGDQVFSFRRGQICKHCKGKGVMHSGQSCPVCNGQKYNMAPRDLKFQLQKGMKNGDVVLFKGQSQQGLDFFPGDVYVKLNEISHSTFKRDGNNLKMKIDISLKEAILGFQRRIPHLDGHQVYIQQLEDIQDGKVLQIQNQGMPIRGQTQVYGKLLARLNIVQKPFSSDQLAQIKKIFDAGRQSQSTQL